MIAAELIIGAVGASVSLGSGLIKFLKEYADHKDPQAMVTIRMGHGTLQKQGALAMQDVSKILDFVDDSQTDGPKSAAKTSGSDPESGARRNP